MSVTRIASEKHSAYDSIRNLHNDLLKYDESKCSWSNDSKSHFIESLLLNLPIHPLYCVEDNHGIRTISDGNSRFSSIYRFLNNSFKLSNLKVLTDLNDLTYSELKPILQSNLDDYMLLFHIIQPPTSSEVIKQLIFNIKS